MAAQQNAGPPSRPLAAYRLGLLSRTFSIHHGLFQQFPESDYGTAEGVSFAIEQMTDSLVTLANDIPVNVYSELRELLGIQSQQWDAVCVMVWEHHESARPWDTSLVATAQQPIRPDLKQLADLALESVTACRGWYDLGGSLGDYMVQVHDHDEGPVPSATALVTTVRALPVANVAVLSRVVELSEKQPDLCPRSLLTQAVLSADEAARWEVFRADADAYVVSRVLLKLDAIVQNELRGITTVPAGAGTDQATNHVVPQWNKETGELRWKGQVVRRVVQRAVNIIAILNTFEEQGWPVKIKDPLAQEIDSKVTAKPQQAANLWRLHDTIKSLNHGLEVLRFHADGASEGVYWQVLPTS